MQSLTWKFRLWRARFAERVLQRQRRLTVTFFARADDPRFEAWVSRFSPFSPEFGYRRVWLRRLAYWFHTPRASFQRDLLRVVTRFTDRYQRRSGRLENFDAATALKVEWLWDHSELSTAEMGDLSDGDPQYSMLFDGIEVPWSRELEVWIVGQDEQGFLSGSQYEDLDEAEFLWTQEEDALERRHAVDDEPFESYFDFDTWDKVTAHYADKED